jgi:histidine triad (HIT) family protein
VSGKSYDFSNPIAKIIAGKTQCHKVYDSKNVFAYLHDTPATKGHTVVVTKTLGFASFLDLPTQKAAEFTAELPKIAQAVKAAVDATDVNICTHASDGESICHPTFHIVPQGSAEKPGLSEDGAKELLTAIKAALHPPPPLKRPKFTKVSSINPVSTGLNLTVKVTGDAVEKELKHGKVYEVKVGDSSGVVTVSLQADQKDLLKSGKSYEVRNASVKMVKGHISVVVDKWGKIEEATVDDIEPNTAKDISATQYELVNGS